MIDVTQAFVPLLRHSAPARVVNMSTPLGSLSLLSDPERGFAARAMLVQHVQSALNCATVIYANALRGDGVLVNAAWPGFVATDLNRNRGSRSASEGAELPVQLALLGEDGPTGQFFTLGDDGTRKVVPW